MQQDNDTPIARRARSLSNLQLSSELWLARNRKLIQPLDAISVFMHVTEAVITVVNTDSVQRSNHTFWLREKTQHDSIQSFG